LAESTLTTSLRESLYTPSGICGETFWFPPTILHIAGEYTINGEVEVEIPTELREKAKLVGRDGLLADVVGVLVEIKIDPWSGR